MKPNTIRRLFNSGQCKRYLKFRKSVFLICIHKIKILNINPIRVNVSQNVPRKQATQVCYYADSHLS